jgi:hypothetical protein
MVVMNSMLASLLIQILAVDAQSVTSISRPLLFVGDLEPSWAIAVVVVHPILDGVLRFVDGIEWRHLHFVSSEFATFAPKEKPRL